jgi:NADP-dependent 3-hydroxy acid dehydrogenase YdfG
MMTVWFVTGASSSLGLEITREALRNGDQVVAAARDPDTVRTALPDAGPALLTVPLDVTDQEGLRAAVRDAVRLFGRIDVLVNNAGQDLLGAVEEASDTEIRAVFETNVFGLLNTTRAVLPILRAQRSGRVLNLSSVGGFVANPGMGVGNATEFAVEGLSEAMRAELAPLGVKVTVVETGFLCSDRFDDCPPMVAGPLPDYTESTGGTRERATDTTRVQPVDPTRAAVVIVAIARATEPPSRLQLGADTVARVEAKLFRVAKELTRWRPIAVLTDCELS